MSYSPTLGRFLEQDPIGSPNTMGPGRAQVTLDAEKSARAKSAELFGESHGDDRWLWKFADGMNSYQFVGSNPVNFTDPSGMDRYLVADGGGAHTGIAVDRWEIVDGKLVKVGQTTFDFSVHYCDVKTAIFIWPGAITFSTVGMVTETDGIRNPDYVTIPSTPSEDEKLLAEMQAQMINPPNYHLIFFNCNHWTQKYQNCGKK